jgi:hypothetical protein
MVEAQNRRIVLHDVSPLVFDLFLRFVYGGLACMQVPMLSVDQLADLLLLADRYEMADLVGAVEAVLLPQLDEDNAGALLGLADQLGTPVFRLRHAAFDYLAARPHLLTRDTLSELPDCLRCGTGRVFLPVLRIRIRSFPFISVVFFGPVPKCSGSRS